MGGVGGGVGGSKQEGEGEAGGGLCNFGLLFWYKPQNISFCHTSFARNFPCLLKIIKYGFVTTFAKTMKPCSHTITIKNATVSVCHYNR